MSDVMGGMPPGPRPPENVISQNRSIMNPIDMAAMTQDGTVTPNMTVKDLIEKVFKVPIDAPVSALVEAIKKQGQNATGIGKVQSMANPMGSAMGPRDGSGPQMANRFPQGNPAAMPPKQGISDLMGGAR